MRWITMSTMNSQYQAGDMSSSYQVRPSSRVRPPASSINLNSPRFARRYPLRCGGWTPLYGLSSQSGAVDGGRERHDEADEPVDREKQQHECGREEQGGNHQAGFEPVPVSPAVQDAPGDRPHDEGRPKEQDRAEVSEGVHPDADHDEADTKTGEHSQHVPPKRGRERGDHVRGV